MRTKISDIFNQIAECMSIKPSDKVMSMWLKRIMALSCFLGVFYAYFTGAYASMALLCGELAIWFFVGEVTRKHLFFYADLTAVTLATCMVDTIFLSGEMGQVGAFLGLLLAMVSVLMLGLFWGNILGLFNCAFVCILFNLEALGWIRERYTVMFCERFPFILISFYAAAVAIQYSISKYEVSKRNYRQRLEKMIEDGKKERSTVSINILLSMYKALSTKSPEIGEHCEEVAEWSKRISHSIGETSSEAGRIYLAGLLHDIGKIGVGSAYYNKKKRMSKAYREEYMKHVDIGYQILYKLNLPQISEAAIYHHERYDGKGYKGLKGEAIPRSARIVAVANTIVQLEKEGCTLETVKEELLNKSGRELDPNIVERTMVVVDEVIKERKEEEIFGKVD